MNNLASANNQHIIGHFGDCYRPDDQTSSVKTLKETSWSSKSGLNPTRTTPPCYNNTTLGNRLYTQHKCPNVTRGGENAQKAEMITLLPNKHHSGNHKTTYEEREQGTAGKQMQRKKYGQQLGTVSDASGE